MTDEHYMDRCLQLAKLGSGNVAPNPMVGSVLVFNDKIIGEGYHKNYGDAHAEVNCLNSVSEKDGSLISKSTLYVSLEPCNHFGKTPPCTNLIIKNNIPKVVIGCKDSFTKVNGKGIEKLDSAGIEVIQNILKSQCIDLNKRFFTFHKKCRPYIILKWAESSDSKIAAGIQSPERTYISNGYANRLVHKWRSEETAIWIGTNTALKDDPLLTTRLWKGNNPIRILLDLNLRLPGYLKVFNGEAQTIIFNKIKEGKKENIEFIKIKTNDILGEIIKKLFSLNILSILVEGGAFLLQSLIDAALWDEARIIRNESIIIGEGISAPLLKNHVFASTQKVFNNSLDIFKQRNI